MDGLNFINQSNDTNNSSVVIFQASAGLSTPLETAWQVISVAPGAKANVTAKTNTIYHASVINPEISVNDGLMTIKEVTSPAVTIKAGQTGTITGDAASGYRIAVKD